MVLFLLKGGFLDMSRVFKVKVRDFDHGFPIFQDQASRPSSRSRFFFLDIDAIFSIVVSLFKIFANPSFYARTRFFDLGLHFNFSPTLF